MQYLYVHLRARPVNYRDLAIRHANRVADASGEGADVDFLESYYRLVGQQILRPRYYYNLACGYLLDDNGLVESVFAPHGSDLTQPDPAKRAGLALSPTGRPVLYFSGGQEYLATTPASQEIGRGDVVNYYVLRVDAGQERYNIVRFGGDAFDGSQPLSDGSYYLAMISSDMYSGAKIGTGGPQFYFPPSTTQRGQNQVVLLGDFYSRQRNNGRAIYTPKAFANEFVASDQAGYANLINGGDFILGRGYTGTINELFNLAAIPISAANNAVWDWLATRQ